MLNPQEKRLLLTLFYAIQTTGMFLLNNQGSKRVSQYCMHVDLNMLTVCHSSSFTESTIGASK